MKPDATTALPKPTPLPSAPTMGCATCWAAKYCAAFSALDSPQPPACPLLPKPTPRRRPRRQLAHG